MIEGKPADPASLDALRADFEAWALKDGRDTTRASHYRDGYRVTATGMMWRSWQARASLEAARAGGREAVAWQCRDRGQDGWPVVFNSRISAETWCKDGGGHGEMRPLYAAAPAQEWRPLLKAAKCPNCDGSGGTGVQKQERQLVTRDMASDAGDPSLEGSVFTEARWEQEQCQWCDERAALLAATPEPPK